MPLVLKPGERFPDLALPDESGQPIRISGLAGGAPLILAFYRGWW
jgi:peroxiredoxin